MVSFVALWADTGGSEKRLSLTLKTVAEFSQMLLNAVTVH
jgi:hypothetical protein